MDLAVLSSGGVGLQSYKHILSVVEGQQIGTCFIYFLLLHCVLFFYFQGWGEVFGMACPNISGLLLSLGNIDWRN